MKKTSSRSERAPQLKLFRSALPCQLTLAEVVRELGDVDGLRCLNVGDEAGLYAYHLRRRGGSWATAVRHEREAVPARELVEDDVQLMQDGRLPFEDKAFDRVVLINQLEAAKDDDLLVEECHRILNVDGKLIVNARNRKPWTLLTPVERAVGATPQRRGLVRPGYTETQLFNILKHGFDVNQMRTYMRFWVEFVRTLSRGSLHAPLDGEALARLTRREALAGPFYRLAYQLDLLLFFSRGFYLVCTAKRRAWLPRKTPVLGDGRSISEAVLSRYGG